MYNTVLPLCASKTRLSFHPLDEFFVRWLPCSAFLCPRTALSRLLKNTPLNFTEFQ